MISTLFNLHVYSIAVITEGKYKELTCQSHLQLMQLMEDTNSEARLNAIKALGLIAETPQGKQELQPALDKVRSMNTAVNH